MPFTFKTQLVFSESRESQQLRSDTTNGIKMNSNNCIRQWTQLRAKRHLQCVMCVALITIPGVGTSRRIDSQAERGYGERWYNPKSNNDNHKPWPWVNRRYAVGKSMCNAHSLSLVSIISGTTAYEWEWCFQCVDPQQTRVYVCYWLVLIFAIASQLRIDGELWWGGLTQNFMIHKRRHIVFVSSMLWIECINSVTLLLFQVWFESNVSVALCCCFKSVSNQVHQQRHIVVVSRLVWVKCIGGVILLLFQTWFQR